MEEVNEINKPTKKEQLELIEKRVEIQRKRFDIKKEKISMEKMVVEKEKEQIGIAKTKLDMEKLLHDKNVEDEKLLNSKMFSVLIALCSRTIDEERTILGSEPFYTPLISGKNRDIAIDKLMELIKRL